MLFVACVKDNIKYERMSDNLNADKTFALQWDHIIETMVTDQASCTERIAIWIMVNSYSVSRILLIVGNSIGCKEPTYVGLVFIRHYGAWSYN